MFGNPYEPRQIPQIAVRILVSDIFVVCTGFRRNFSNVLWVLVCRVTLAKVFLKLSICDCKVPALSFFSFFVLSNKILLILML